MIISPRKQLSKNNQNLRTYLKHAANLDNSPGGVDPQLPKAVVGGSCVAEWRSDRADGGVYRAAYTSGRRGVAGAYM